MEVESSLVAAQNALTIAPAPREPQKQAETREQQNQRQATELPVAQVVVRQPNAQAYEQAEEFRQQQGFQERANSRAQEAINAYQSLASNQQREELQQMLGVDTYA